MMPVKLKKPTKQSKSKEPLWRGPEVDGVTQSLLGRYLCCKERFRLLVMEGLRVGEEFSQRIHYGNMWHVCEEALAKSNLGNWETDLKWYCQELAKEFPLQGQQIEHWYNICKLQFPIYVAWWAKHKDVKNRKPLLEEVSFNVPYKLPSGRTVGLRGKWDSVDLAGKEIWLQENKTKGDIDERQLVRQLTFDLQTMMYIIALGYAPYDRSEPVRRVANHAVGREWWKQIAGVRYNVIRRPLAGGKGSISQRKGRQTNKGLVGSETLPEFYARLADLIENAHGPEYDLPKGEHYFFMRWNVNIIQSDIDKFKRECLDPVLENLLDDYEWWAHCFSNGIPNLLWDYGIRGARFPKHSERHLRLPYGIWNPLLEGRSTDLDEYLATGSTVGLQRTDNLFKELA